MDNQQGSKTASATQAKHQMLPLRLLGPGVLLGWHFLILYFPLDATANVTEHTLLLRQVALNCSLFVFFLASALIIEKISQRGRVTTTPFVTIVASIAVLGGIGVIATPPLWGNAGIIVSVAFMGSGEATLMLPWLRFYADVAVSYAGRYLAASTAIGALICFFARCLTFEASLIVFVALPLLSAAMLLVASRTDLFRENEEGGKGLSDWPSARGPFMKSTAQLIIFSIAFGLLQGCVSSGSTLLPVANPIAMLGVGIAGAAVVALYQSSPIAPDLRPVHKASLLLFSAGVLAIPFSSSLISHLAAVAIMTGFLLYDILILIFTIDLIRTFDLRPAPVLGLNRSCEYAGFTIGICLGYFVWNHFSTTGEFPYLLSSVTAFVSFAAALFLMTEKNIWHAKAYVTEPTGKAEECTREDPASAFDIHQSACENVCTRFALTPREREVFMLLSKGRNAEYIQSALCISSHTVKTHISNIYKKIDIHSAQELLDAIDREQEDAGR